MTIKAWQGPSTIDGKSIMAVISCEKTKSRNIKTGDMVQVAFFSTLEKPVPLRPKVWTKEVSDEPCYVGLHWKGRQWSTALALSADMKAARDVLGNKPVRFGEYGNMSSIPREVSEQLLQAAEKWTLYEHEWRKESNQWLRHYAMASVHSIEEAEEAWAMGWRTFRVTKDGEHPEDNEIECPYVQRGTQCASCLLCNGKKKGKDKRKSITVPAH